MTRQHPFFSRIGCLGGSILILGLFIAVIVSGGIIFSPGPLTAVAKKGQLLQGARSHAEFEADCRQCHAPFQGIAVERCEACHTDVRDERASGQGLHGHLAPDLSARCGRCHDDHEGPQHDPSAAALKIFDHAVIGFSLVRHVTDYELQPLACDACHSLPGYALETSRCADCHTAQDPAFMQDHQAAFGADCQTCHDGVDHAAAFDHAEAAFPLEGLHAGLACADCHDPAVAPPDTPSQCAGCHAAPVHHAGALGDDCSACHKPLAWTPADLPDFPAFEHARTAFQLTNHAADYAGAPLNCRACHDVEAGFTVSLQACADCHSRQDPAFMAQHLQDFGPKCVACHDGAGNMLNFDHALVFALDGAHAALTCDRCHAETFRGTSRECSACHAEPPIHAGLFGLMCEGCHTTTAWSPAQLTQHAFPLNHGEQGEIACDVCHTASYVAYTCTNCHDHEPEEMRREHDEVNLGGRPLEQCAACHPDGRKSEGD